MADIKEAASNSPSDTTTSVLVQIVEHLDGTITRPFIPLSPPSPNPPPVLSKDVVLNPTHRTSLRLYLPAASGKLPILLFFHGGGFVLFNYSSTIYHICCESMSLSLPALVVSLDYRLAPEHRLPAAYDDAVEALLWLRESNDPWITNHGDLSKVFLTGSSSGANIAYQVAVRSSKLHLPPLNLCGLVLNQPYFGGVERTHSERELEGDSILPLRANDTLWRLSLPKGVDRDHEFSNPVKADGKVVKLPRCLVKGSKGDPLLDRQREFAKWLEEGGVEVVEKIDPEGFHAAELFVENKAAELFGEIREFVYANDR
ncbi:carboxylesterase 1-like [Typha latifolia]|uniref:carboxylesterase 1-like n=1 Tax=Typha latifolia TaxID=4733 RepID=UPI003C2AB727